MLGKRTAFAAGSLALAALSVGGCPQPPAGGDGNGNGNGSGGGNLQVIVTDHIVDGELKVGRGFVAFGVDSGSGINFVRKGSVASAINLSNSLSLMSSGFNVAGTWILAREFDGSVYFYDTATDTLVTVPTNTLALASGSALLDEFWSDGDYAVTLADATKVSDGLPIKLIDCTTNPPTITSFTQTPPTPTGSRSGERPQCAVDAENREFIVQVVDSLYLYSFDDPTGAPQVFDLSGEGGISNSISVFLEDRFVLYHDNEGVSDGRDVTRLADLSGGLVYNLAQNPSAPEDVFLRDGFFGYFVEQTDADINTNTQYRSVFGQIGANGPEFTLISTTDKAIKNNDPDQGLFGYGQTVAITSNGKYRFIAGDGTAANIAEYLQVSVNGGAFKTLEDPEDNDDAGIFGSNVVATDEACAFTTLDQRLALILLP